MRLFYSEAHARHDPGQWLEKGRIYEYYDCPARAYAIRDAIIASGLGMFELPFENPDQHITGVHSHDKINFLKRNNQKRIVTYESRPDIVLESDEALSLSPGSYEAARAAVSCALSGAYVLSAGVEGASYALCRPPGHHATRQKAGGHCFFNNAAIAAKYLRDNGKGRPAILDIDVHHGNGTQEIIYDEQDMFFVSLNGAHIYPHHLNKIADRKQDPYLTSPAILNVSMESSTDDLCYLRFIDTAVDWIKSVADVIVVSAGFDTSARERKDLFENDPDPAGWEKFGLTEDCYYKIGKKIRQARLPVLAVQEGGYNTSYLGQDIVSFLHGLAGE